MCNIQIAVILLGYCLQLELVCMSLQQLIHNSAQFVELYGLEEFLSVCVRSVVTN